MLTIRANTRHQILTEDAKPVQKRNPNVPVDLAAIVHRCLEKDPDERYPSMEGLEADLRAFLDGKPVRVEGVVRVNTERHARDQQLVGILLCLGAAFSYGLDGFWAKRRLTGVPALTSATCQLLCSSLMMLPLAAGLGNIASLATASGRAWLSLLAFALLSTALAYIVFFKIVTRSGPFAVMLVTMLIPVSAIAMGAAFLGEPIAAREIAGAIVISLALLLIDGRVLGRLGRSRPA